jgi:hypothetical protein
MARGLCILNLGLGHHVSTRRDEQSGKGVMAGMRMKNYTRPSVCDTGWVTLVNILEDTR